jgi:hypothetical protein
MAGIFKKPTHDDRRDVIKVVKEAKVNFPVREMCWRIVGFILLLA